MKKIIFCLVFFLNGCGGYVVLNERDYTRLRQLAELSTLQKDLQKLTLSEVFELYQSEIDYGITFGFTEWELEKMKVMKKVIREKIEEKEKK